MKTIATIPRALNAAITPTTREARKRRRGFRLEWMPFAAAAIMACGSSRGQTMDVTSGTTLLTNSAVTTPGVVISSGATLQYDVTSGQITQPALDISGSGTLLKTGSGILVFGGGGNIHWNLGSGALIDVEGGTLVGGSFVEDFWTNNLASLHIAAGAVFQGQEANLQVDALTGAGSFTGGDNFSGYTQTTIGVNNGSGTFAGSISDETTPLNLVKAGTGTQILSGTNTYTGTTTISAGTLQFAKEVSLYNNSPAGVANVSVASGATIGFNVGGTGEFTAPDLNVILANRAGFASGAQLGLDTTNAAGGNFTYNSVITNANGGANSMGLTKLGTGALTLTQSNTYTGNTNVNGGTLTLAGGGTLYNGGTSAGNLIINTGGTLLLKEQDAFGNATSFNPMKLTVNGGTVESNGFFNSFNNPTFNGGNLLLNGGNSPDFQAFGLKGTVTIGGSSATIFSTTGAGSFNGIDLGNQITHVSTTFDVARTGVAGPDLIVSVSFVNNSVGNASGLIKTGAGVMLLSGTNTYTGPTGISAGTLQFAKEVSLYNNTPAGAANVSVASGATIALNVGGPGEFTASDLNTIQAHSNGFASGARLGLDTTNAAGGNFTDSSPITDANGGASAMVLVKLGVGTLTLTAANTYSGGTSLEAGVIGIGNARALGSGAVTIGAGGGSIYAAGADQTVSNAFTLNGGLTVINDPAGAHNLTLAGLVTGSGGITMNGTGSLILSGANTYTGDTLVNQGALFVDGSIASANTTVAQGGLLGGHGVLAGNLNNNGVVSPGNSPGTLTVRGNFTQSSGGVLLIEIAGLAPAQHDLLAISGSAALAGTLRLQQLNGFQFQLGDKVTFLTAGGGVSGAFGTVVNPFSTGTMIGTQVVYGANSVSIEAIQSSFAALVKASSSSVPWETQNQAAIARSLDASISDPRNARLIARLDDETLDKVLSDLDRISPEALTSAFQIAISQAKTQTANLQRRLEDVRAGSNGFSTARFAMNGTAAGFSGPLGDAGLAQAQGPDGKGGKMALTPAPDNRWGIFVTGTGEWANVGDTGNARGYDLTNAGFTLGIDYKLTDHFVIGLATGYDHSSADLSGNGRVIVDGGKLALYASYFTGQGFYTDVSVGGGYNSYDTHRAALDGSAIGSAAGGELTVLFGTGYDWKCGGLTFGPIANFEYTYVGLDSFGERGSLAPLNFPSRHQESLRSTFGAKVSYDWKIGHLLVRPELRVAWQHEYGDATLAIDSAFANGAGPGFLVHGPATGRDSLLLSAGFAVQLSERVSTYVYYDGELARTNYQASSISGGFRFDF